MRAVFCALLVCFFSLAFGQVPAVEETKRRQDEMARMLAQRVPSGEELFCAKQRVAVEAAKWDIDNHIERRPVYLEPGFTRAPLVELHLRQQQYRQLSDEYRVRCAGR